MELYTVEEAAAILKVTPKTVRSWIALRGLPAAKLGKEYRIPKQDFENWISQSVKGEAVGSF
jgi:excisionase family DNA binding protein